MRGQSKEHVHDAAHTHDSTSSNRAAPWESNFTDWLRRAFGTIRDRNAVVTMNPDGKLVCVERIDGR